MWTWFGLAVLALIGEILTGTFYLLLVAIGLAAGGAAVVFDAGLETQLVVCGLVVVGGMLLLRATGVLKKREIDASRNADVNLDIGQVVNVKEWSASGTARVAYRGASWEVALGPGCEAVPGEQVIIEVRGSRLIVTPRPPARPSR